MHKSARVGLAGEDAKGSQAGTARVDNQLQQTFLRRGVMSVSTSIGPISGIDYGKLITGLTSPDQSPSIAISTKTNEARVAELGHPGAIDAADRAESVGGELHECGGVSGDDGNQRRYGHHQCDGGNRDTGGELLIQRAASGGGQPAGDAGVCQHDVAAGPVGEHHAATGRRAAG